MRSQITLSQMVYEGGMSTTDNQLEFQRLLPVHLQGKWSQTAHTLMEARVLSNFTHMTDFVEVQANVASNVFGENVGQQKSAKPMAGSAIVKKQTKTFATHGSSSKGPSAKQEACLCCTGAHGRQACRKSKDLRQKDT